MAQKGINFKITAINKTKTAFSQIGRGLKGIGKAVFSFKSALVGVVGAGALGLLIKQSLTATDRLGKMSNVLGIAVKDLQTLKLASEIGGIEFETFAKATRRMTDNFGDFLNGTGEATVTFKALGISVADANRLSGDQMAILELVADRLNLVENRTLKLKYAQEIFGGRGAELINVLDGGSEALKRFAKESDRFGSLNEKQVQAVEDFNDSMVRLKTVFFNTVNLVVSHLSPAFLEFSEYLRGKFLEHLDKAEGGAVGFARNFSNAIVDMLEKGAKGMTIFANMVVEAFNKLIEAFNRLPFVKDFNYLTTHFVIPKTFLDSLEIIRKQIDAIGEDEPFEKIKKNSDKLADTGKELEGIYATVYDRLVRLNNASAQFGNTIAKSFENALFQAKNLSEAIRELGANLVRLVYQKTVTEPLAEKISGIINTVLGNAKKQTEQIAQKNRDITQAVIETNAVRLHANSIENTNLVLLDMKLAKEKSITKEKENQKKAQGTAMLMSGNPLGFLAFMHKGGHVEKNSPYVVGEKGAELFVPSSSGEIIPNHKIGNSSNDGVSGQDSIKVVQEISIMPSVSATARAEIFGMLPLIKQEALNGVMDARNRGGSFARAMGVKA